MALDGNNLTYTPDLDFSEVQAVVVSGAKLNPCGHMILFVPFRLAVSSFDGLYFHVAPDKGIKDFPKVMTAKGYRDYLTGHTKSELKRQAVKLPKPNDARVKLMDLMGKKWTWGVLPNNCASFVEEVIQSGGVTSWGIYSNCPKMLD